MLILEESGTLRGGGRCENTTAAGNGLILYINPKSVPELVGRATLMTFLSEWIQLSQTTFIDTRISPKPRPNVTDLSNSQSIPAFLNFE